MSYHQFFKDHEDYCITAQFYECNRSFTLDELYEAFKDRLTDELVATSDELLRPATLEEAPDEEWT